MPKTDWIISPGKTKTVYNPETGEPRQIVVAPWIAEYVGGGARLHASSEEILSAQIEAHPYENGQRPAPVVLTR